VRRAVWLTTAVVVVVAAVTVGLFTTSPSRPSTGRPLTVFIGDSYTVGVGAPKGGSFAELTADAMGWRPVFLAAGGTGYLNPGPRGAGPYPSRVQQVPEDADWVIVTGGVNDRSRFRDDPERFARAVDTTLEGARAAAPDAVVVAVGPFWPFDPTDSALAHDMDAAVRDAADRTGVPFLSPLGDKWWPTAELDGLLARDGLHPNRAGHRLLAKRLSEALEGLSG
jgi:lysophospholipase L1-like esterase